MTGKYKGTMRKLEELLRRPLQWCICLLHCVELPLRHVFVIVDGIYTQCSAGELEHRAVLCLLSLLVHDISGC